MAFIDRSTRVGRSQGASIFWGLVSVSFAAAACFYYFQNQKNEAVANQMRDTVLQLKEENESLNSEKDHLQSSQTEAANQLKTREDLVQQKETQLADEEVRLENLGQQAQNQTPQNQAQVAVVKKFNDVIRRIGKDVPPDVVGAWRPARAARSQRDPICARRRNVEAGRQGPAEPDRRGAQRPAR